MSSRGSAPAVGVALLLFLAVGLSAAVGAAALGTIDAQSDPAPTAVLSLTTENGAFVFTHRGGDSLNVRTLRVAVEVDGTPLAHQPPVPFFAATGFVSGPTGPFNVASDPRWTAGERATFEPAETNAPAVEADSSVAVEIYVNGYRLLRLTAKG